MNPVPEIETANSTSWSLWYRMGWVLPVLLLAGYTAFIVRYTWDGAGAWDTAGYMNCARMLGEGRCKLVQRVLPGADVKKLRSETFVPMTSFVSVGHGEMGAVYPPGLPLAVASLARITGWDNISRTVMPLTALLGVLAVCLLARFSGLSILVSWYAAAAVGLGPLYLMMAGFLMSDLPAMVCATVGVAFAWRAHCTRGNGSAFLSGISVAAAVLVRPTNGVILLPVAICLGPDWRRWIALGLGGLPGAIFLFLYNDTAFGGLLKTGYGLAINGSFFGVHYAWPFILYCLRWLPLLLPLGFLVFALPWCRGCNRRLVLVLLSWFLAYPVPYSIFNGSALWWWQLRYILPIFPAGVVGGLLVMESWMGFRCQTVAPGGGLWKRILFSTVCALVLVVELIGASKLDIYSSGRQMRVFMLASKWAAENFPPESVIVGFEITGSAYYYTAFPLVRWDQVRDPDRWKEITRAAAAGSRPIYAIFLRGEEQVKPGDLAKGWSKIHEMPCFDFWRWDGNASPGGM